MKRKIDDIVVLVVPRGTTDKHLLLLSTPQKAELMDYICNNFSDIKAVEGPLTLVREGQ